MNPNLQINVFHLFRFYVFWNENPFYEFGCRSWDPPVPGKAPIQQRVIITWGGGLDFPYGENLIFPHFVITVARDWDRPASPIVGWLGLGQCLPPLSISRRIRGWYFACPCDVANTSWGREQSTQHTLKNSILQASTTHRMLALFPATIAHAASRRKRSRVSPPSLGWCVRF
jgi:hypothetical protein